MNYAWRLLLISQIENTSSCTQKALIKSTSKVKQQRQAIIKNSEFVFLLVFPFINDSRC